MVGSVEQPRRDVHSRPFRAVRPTLYMERCFVVWACSSESESEYRQGQVILSLLASRSSRCIDNRLELTDYLRLQVKSRTNHRYTRLLGGRLVPAAYQCDHTLDSLTDMRCDSMISSVDKEYQASKHMESCIWQVQQCVRTV